jgi:hypothetical protein
MLADSRSQVNEPGLQIARSLPVPAATTLGSMRDDERQAERDAAVARHLAADSLLRESAARRPGSNKPADMVEGYAMQLLDHLDGSVPRALSAAQAACVAAATEVAHPTRWRAAMRAVELCRHAAHLGGHTAPADDVLPRPDPAGPAGFAGLADAAPASPGPEASAAAVSGDQPAAG